LLRKRLKKNLQKSMNEMILASLGLEHLFRELGQMYESVMEVKKANRKCKEGSKVNKYYIFQQ